MARKKKSEKNINDVQKTVQEDKPKLETKVAEPNKRKRKKEVEEKIKKENKIPTISICHRCKKRFRTTERNSLYVLFEENSIALCSTCFAPIFMQKIKNSGFADDLKQLEKEQLLMMKRTQDIVSKLGMMTEAEKEFAIIQMQQQAMEKAEMEQKFLEKQE